jgi:hypothetical protein
VEAITKTTCLGSKKEVITTEPLSFFPARRTRPRELRHISLAIAVRATAWLGFGLSENGGMAGADLFLFEASKPNEVRDAHVMDELLPLDDDCNNWEFVSSEVDENSDFLIVEVRRLIDTGDPQDRALIQDSTVDLPPLLVISA